MASNQSSTQGERGRADAGEIGRRVAISSLTWGLVWLGLIILAFLAWQLRVVLAMVFLAILLAAAMRNPVRIIEGWGLPRVAGVAISYLLLLAVLGLGIWLIVPPLVEQASSFVQNLPDTIDRLLGWVRDTAAPILPGDAVQQAIDGVRSSLDQFLPGIQSALQVPLVVVGVLINVVLILFLSAFLILDGQSMWDAILGYVHPERRQRMRAIGESVMGKLGSYVIGQLVIMTFTGVGSALGMLIIGVPYVLPLGFLAFITEAIPLAGPWIAGIPITLVAFVQSPLQGIFMGAWILALQQLEGYVMVPIVQKRAIQVSSTIVLLAVVAGGAVAGVLGALIAIPLVAVSQVIMREVVLPARRNTWQEGQPEAEGGPSDTDSA